LSISRCAPTFTTAGILVFMMRFPTEAYLMCI